MSSVIFISEGNISSASVKHRCLMISDNLMNHDYSSEVFTSGNFMKTTNFFNQIINYRKALKEKPDIVIIHRSSNIIDYYMIKKLKRLQIKVVFDFDDALFHIRFPGRLIAYSHLEKIIKISDAVTAGSHYLKDYASKFNNNVFLLPTPVCDDLFSSNFKKERKDKFVIGWLGNGTKYQLKYLKILKEPLNIISKDYDIKFRIVSAFSNSIVKEFDDVNYEVDFGLDHWISLEDVPEIISDFDVGVMPLTDEPFSKGKCAMKALEYMSMNIPVIVSPVGENIHVIKNGYNGFLAKNTSDWISYIQQIIQNKVLRREIGINGRKTIESQYSLNVITKKMINVLEALK